MPDISDRSVAPEVRNRVLSSRGRFWRPEDFGGSPEAVAKVLSRLTHAEELRRVRRGLYWRKERPRASACLPHRPAASSTRSSIRRARALPVGALHSRSGSPRKYRAARRSRCPVAPRNPGTVRFVSRAASVKRRDERLRPPEVALLEVLRDWDTLVEVPTDAAVGRIAGLAGIGTLRLDRVVRASTTEPPRVRERLRRLLTAMDRSTDAAAVRPARRESVRRDLTLAG